MKKLEVWLKQFLIYLIKIFLPRSNNDRDLNGWQKFNRILVFRLDNRLGNTILVLSLIQSIKKSIPNVNIDVLMTSTYIGLYKDHPAIQSSIPYDQKYLFRNPIRFLFLIHQLRKNKYDAVFSSNNPDAFSVSQAIFNRLISQNRSVGFDWKESARLYTDVVPGNIKIHYAQSQYDLWRHFDKNAWYDPPKLYFVEKKKSQSPEKILIWLGATGQKILSEDLVNSIIMAVEDLNVDYHLALGPHDRHILKRYAKPWRSEIQIKTLDLKGIATYFMSYKCICMPDTGPMHLVAALEIPLVQVFINSNIRQYGYLGPKNYIIDKDIDTDSLKQFIRKQLDVAK